MGLCGWEAGDRRLAVAQLQLQPGARSQAAAVHKSRRDLRLLAPGRGQRVLFSWIGGAGCRRNDFHMAGRASASHMSPLCVADSKFRQCCHSPASATWSRCGQGTCQRCSPAVCQLIRQKGACRNNALYARIVHELGRALAPLRGVYQQTRMFESIAGQLTPRRRIEYLKRKPPATVGSEHFGAAR